jgi:hypothetical protein
MTILAGIGASQTVSSASGGKIFGYNNITNLANTIVAQPNQARKQIIFHNPGTVDVLVSPTVIQNIIGTAPTNPSNVAFVPTPTVYGGTFRVYANGGTLMVDGECQGAWQALAITGTTNQLTVMESNV